MLKFFLDESMEVCNPGNGGLDGAPFGLKLGHAFENGDLIFQGPDSLEEGSAIGFLGVGVLGGGGGGSHGPGVDGGDELWRLGVAGLGLAVR